MNASPSEPMILQAFSAAQYQTIRQYIMTAEITAVVFDPTDDVWDAYVSGQYTGSFADQAACQEWIEAFPDILDEVGHLCVLYVRYLLDHAKIPSLDGDARERDPVRPCPTLLASIAYAEPHFTVAHPSLGNTTGLTAEEALPTLATFVVNDLLELTRETESDSIVDDVYRHIMLGRQQEQILRQGDDMFSQIMSEVLKHMKEL